MLCNEQRIVFLPPPRQALWCTMQPLILSWSPVPSVHALQPHALHHHHQFTCHLEPSFLLILT